MKQEAKMGVRAPYSVLFVGDPDGESPDPSAISPGVVAASRARIVVGTLAESDGETQVLLVVDDEGNINVPPLLAFDGLLQIASRQLTVESALGEIYLQLPVHKEEVRLRVWVNDKTEPDEIAIVVT